MRGLYGLVNGLTCG